MRWVVCACTVVMIMAAGSVLGESPAEQILGRIRDSKGRGIAGAEVALIDSSGSSQRTFSDPFGVFILQTGAGTYSVLVQKNAFVPSALEIEVSPGETRELEILLTATEELKLNERVTVVGSNSSAERATGSAQYLDAVELERLKVDVDDIHQLLRSLPGVNVQQEDGYGLRPNIGMRGSGTERSSKITLMEDGVLIAPAPYASPSAYYFPTSGRMEAIELRKGSSQIRFGPRTNGGALNLVSSLVPQDLRVNGNVVFGSERFRKFHFNLGDSYENVGWLLETYQAATDGFKDIDGGGDSGFELEDYLAKVRFNSSRGSSLYQQLELKFGYTEQDSEETYLGLTDSDFASKPNRRYAASQPDNFRSRHRQMQVRYFLAPSQLLDVTATYYRNDFKRNWYKLESISGIGLSRIFADPMEFDRQLNVARGQTSDTDELSVRANNRRYYSQGIETIAAVRLRESAELASTFEFGLRYHEDEEDRFQHEDGFTMMDGTMVRTSRGAPGSQSNRISRASAWAVFVQNTTSFGKLTLSPGIRYEKIDLGRIDYSTTDPDRTAPTRVRRNNVGVVIPGLGALYEVADGIAILGGIHRGFAPPGPGSDEFTDSEESINYEWGVRLNRQPVQLEVLGFYNSYSNLLGADSLSSGGSGTGDLFNGGRARTTGIEASAFYDAGTSTSFRIPVRLTYTFTNGKFRNAFESDFAPWGNVEVGDEIPYLSPHQFYGSLGLGRQKWRTRLETVYQARMRAQAGQGPVDPLHATDSYWVVNVSGEYDLGGLSGEFAHASLFLSLRNVFDNDFIVARRPAGVRPGLPRTLTGGLRFRLGR